MNRDPCLSVMPSRKSFAGRKGFFFAKSSRSSRLRGESWAVLSPRRREAREENAKDLSLVAAMSRRVHLWFRSFLWNSWPVKPPRILRIKHDLNPSQLSHTHSISFRFYSADLPELSTIR